MGSNAPRSDLITYSIFLVLLSCLLPPVLCVGRNMCHKTRRLVRLRWAAERGHVEDTFIFQHTAAVTREVTNITKTLIGSTCTRFVKPRMVVRQTRVQGEKMEYIINALSERDWRGEENTNEKYIRAEINVVRVLFRQKWVLQRSEVLEKKIT